MKNYPLYKTEPIFSLKELVNLSAERYGEMPAFTFERKKQITSISYNKFKADVNALGTEFKFLEIKSEKIAVIGENSYEWILTYFAAVNGGNVIVPLDKELPAADIKNLIDDSGAEIFVYSSEYTDIMNHLQESGANIRKFICMKEIPQMLEHGATLVQGGDTSVIDYKVDNKALAALLYTSGTTGSAKGVMLSHFSIARNTVASCEYVELLGRNLLVLPVHHVFGFVAGVCVMLHKGSEICINSSLKNVLSDLEKFKPHCVFLVPLFVETFYKKIWDGAKKKGKDGLLKKLIGISGALMKIGIDPRRKLFKSVLSAFGGNLGLIVSGGAPLDAKYAQGLRDFGIHVLNGYGITECSPVVSVNRNKYYCDGSIGPVLNCCEVKILNPDEQGHGEICVKGDIVMLGYYNNEQATKEVFDGEWFKTGDIGCLDKDGFLHISGRKKNLIILSNGKNVYPEEIESELLNYIPYVKEVVVYAEDNTIVAEVFLDSETAPPNTSRLDNDIVSFNKTQASYKNIGKTIKRDTEFPKTTTKKIKRKYK
ncbi:MAG: AMP-binding protein [Defluviitaleaceae bacterium]|nr:AMP-binding protein [Defluviitaleaceae bacterium]